MHTDAAVEPLAEIDALLAHRGRVAGSDAERRAAGHLRSRLESLGREAHLEPARVWPQWSLVHTIHAVAAIGGSLLALASPLAATILLALVALSAVGDVSGRLPLARRLTTSRATQNVVSSEDGGHAGTLILVAHYDAARTGAAFGRLLGEQRATLGRALRRPIGPFEPLLLAILAVLACAALRLAGIDARAVSAVQFVATVVLIVAVPLLIDVALSGVVPGANDNASGVTTVLRLAERYGGTLDHFDVWVLFTGAEEAMQLGMRAWLRRNRRRLDRATTAIVCVDEVGVGDVRYARKEGFLVARKAHPALLEVCQQIAAEDAESEGRYRARPFSARTGSDASAATAAGFPSVRVACGDETDRAALHHRPADTTDNLDPEALERAFRFCSELVELIDEKVGPDVERAAAARA